jgi:CRISPR-associated protein Cas2
MYYCVAYDISNDKLRPKIIKLCKQAGLHRLQKSIFVGKSRHDLIHDLETTAKQLLPNSDKLFILPIDEAHWKQLTLLGKNTQWLTAQKSLFVRCF